MGILDEAIKEHLELKRQHGAAEDELRQLEGEAFGAAERPGAEKGEGDALAEAPTEFMAQPDLEVSETGEGEGEVAHEGTAPEASEGAGRPAPRSEIAELQEGPPEADEPVEEESPAMEHEAIPEAPTESPGSDADIPTGPTTEEREAIAEQPTEMYDVEEELDSSQAPAPSEEELVEEEIDEPRLAPVDPLAGLDEEGEDEDEEEYEEDDDFWDEKRLSDELDQALEAPSEVEDEEALYEDAATEAEEHDESAPEATAPAGEQDDVLEETPDFLEEAPEDDQLWFEQKPPKDFDFDD
jgi:hypothetical protein